MNTYRQYPKHHGTSTKQQTEAIILLIAVFSMPFQVDQMAQSGKDVQHRRIVPLSVAGQCRVMVPNVTLRPKKTCTTAADETSV
jgi:hypothetical protein